MRERLFKRTITELLQTASLSELDAALRGYDEQQLLNPLFSGICRSEERLKWHAVAAMGPVVARLADREMEAARVVMRRLMWSLNDESGGIGWGAPEAMAEVLACHAGLAQEYTHVLVSFMREDGFFIEYEPLQRGLMWGLARLAAMRPSLLAAKGATGYLLPYLDSEDAAVRGLAARALGMLQAKDAASPLAQLFGDHRPVRFWQAEGMVEASVAELARQALADLASPGRQ
ncbi:MAG: HEAT repeat domain-containing protein [Desulfobulbaceae bacterium]|nr:HEAT repeat domain-containing protein [Desulfobulbaceae bacterium]